MGAQLALFVNTVPAPAPTVLTVVPAPPVELIVPAKPLTLTDRVKAWLVEQHDKVTAPVKFYHLTDAFPDESVTDLNDAAQPFEIGHDDGPNTYEAT